MATPAKIKNWLAAPGLNKRETERKIATLEYIRRLENIVAAYTKRDGKLEVEKHDVN